MFFLQPDSIDKELLTQVKQRLESVADRVHSKIGRAFLKLLSLDEKANAWMVQSRFFERLDKTEPEELNTVFLDEIRLIAAAVLDKTAYDRVEKIIGRIPESAYQSSADRRSFRTNDPRIHSQQIAVFVAESMYFPWTGFDLAGYLALAPQKREAAKIPAISNLFLSELIAFEIDSGNTNVIAAIRAICTGDNQAGLLDHKLLLGMVKCHDTQMHSLLGDLLLAARLQEGLRQSILETADMGCIAALIHLMKTVLDHDLLRYSSAMRAVAVWFGLAYTVEDRRVIEKILTLGYRYLTDEAARRASYDSKDAIEVYVGLWATGVNAAEDTLPVIRTLLGREKYQRLIALALLGELNQPFLQVETAAGFLQETDPDVLCYVLANYSIDYLYSWPKSPDSLRETSRSFPILKNEETRIRHFSRLTEILRATPAGGHHVSGKPFPWSSLSLNRAAIFSKMLAIAAYEHDLEMVAVLIDLAPLVDANSRKRLLEMYLDFTTPGSGMPSPKERAFLFDCLSDKSMTVRTQALRNLELLQLDAEETIRIEALLTLKTGEIRQIAIQLLLSQSARQDSISRLLQNKSENSRLAGLDMLVHLNEKNEIDAKGLAGLLELIPEAKKGDKEKILIDKLTGSGNDFSIENGFGLFDPAYRPHLPLPAIDKTFSLHALLSAPKEDMVARIASLCALIEQHKDHAYTTEEYDGTLKEVVLGTCDYLIFPAGATSEKSLDDYVLAEVWKNWLAEQQITAEQLFPMLFAKSLGYRLNLSLMQPYRYTAEIAQILDRFFSVDSLREIMVEIRKLKYCNLALNILRLLMQNIPKQTWNRMFIAALSELIDKIPEDYWQKPVSKATDDETLDFMYSQPMRPFILADTWEINAFVQMLARIQPDDEAFAHKLAIGFELGRLSGRLQVGLDEKDLASAVELGLVKEDALLNYLVSPDHGQDMIKRYTSPSSRHKPTLKKYPVLYQCIDRVIDRVIAIELERGDSATAVSALADSIEEHRGAATFARILVALGGETFVRGYAYDQSYTKKTVLSSLLKACRPAEDDTAATLKTALDGRIGEKRLLEAALYAPAWIGLVEEYLGWPGLKSAAWYFHAHTNQMFSAEKETEVARFSNIAPERFVDGAFDIVWFRDAYQTLGEKRFAMLYDCAKYICDGANHRRAQLFADASTGKLDPATTQRAAHDKRNKDQMLAYSLIPLATKRPEKDALERYQSIQNFLKESRQFGAARRENEKKICEIALENLVRNAGFADVNRFVWQMETDKIEQVRVYFEPHAIDNVTLQLTVNERGNADIVCTKAGKTLKAIPSALAKNDYVVTLKTLKTELKDQYRRARASLEAAMEKEEHFTAQELGRLSGHPVIAPLIAQLVFRFGEQSGFFRDDNLVDPDGKKIALPADARLTLAHPVDLYRSGEWSRYQKHLFTAQIAQPFKQVFRELYRINEDEVRSGSQSHRYTGHQVQPRKTVALLKSRGWTVDYDTGLQKVYFKENIIATVYAAADWFSPADIESPTLETVQFFARDTGKPTKLDQVPAIVFSETMRDIDLVVSIAHVGGVDPEASHSTIELRTVIVAELLPLLNIGNVTLKDQHARITGTLGEYTVHLGSGMVHQMGRGAINILAVPSQHRGRIFLPFVDEDPRTAEILSKILLLAEDNTIKDPAILSQIG